MIGQKRAEEIAYKIQSNEDWAILMKEQLNDTYCSIVTTADNKVANIAALAQAGNTSESTLFYRWFNNCQESNSMTDNELIDLAISNYVCIIAADKLATALKGAIPIVLTNGTKIDICHGVTVYLDEVGSTTISSIIVRFRCKGATSKFYKFRILFRKQPEYRYLDRNIVLELTQQDSINTGAITAETNIKQLTVNYIKDFLLKNAR